ncbi:MAG: hypothetical protein JWO60_2735 [Frankiales bacterium]|nr:hypothetical protein [Frankiales bacterium]
MAAPGWSGGVSPWPDAPQPGAPVPAVSPRRLLATGLLAVAAVSAAVAAPALAAAPPTPTAAERAAAPDAGAVLNILPPGSNGTTTAPDFAAFNAGGTRPTNSVDQLEMYDALNKLGTGTLTNGELTKYFKDGTLGVDPADVVRTYAPRDGVVVLRDKAGVPHVYGSTYAATVFGAGYVGTEDRMFLTDVLRHTGAARLAEFIGPSAGNIAMDREQLQAAAYTPQEATAQLAALPKRFGAEGQKLVDAVDDFVAGINAAQDALCPVLVAPTCPVEYAALQQLPTDYTPADIVYIASLVGGIFGRGGGNEYANADFLQKLQTSYGAVNGRKVFDDLKERDDPEAVITIPTRFPYDVPGTVDPRAVALQKLGAPVGSGTGDAPGATTAGASSATPLVVDGPLGKIDLGPALHKSGMSNALLVDAAHSEGGHPVVVFGPQTGYFAPQLLTEVDLHGPGVAARGVSFAGTQLVVELGHGVDYAWSATSSGSDNVDTVFERLCNADGSRPTVQSSGYLVGTTCTPIDTYTHTELAKPSAGAPAPPQQIEFQVLRTRHGIVQRRTTTVDGTPVAVVLQRSTYGSELDSAVGFARVNDPDYVKSAADFQRAFAGVDYTFNWFYADSKDIALFSSGRLPLRAPGVDPALPRFGDARWDWKGFLSDAAHPQAVNPPAGYMVNWNNKTAPGFSAADDQYGYGSVYRSLSLQERVLFRLRNGRKVSKVGLVDAMQDAATVDVRGQQLLPELLAVIGDDPSLKPATDLLATWKRLGAHREDRDRDGAYTLQAAVALMDAWYPVLAKDVFRGAVGANVDSIPTRVDDHPTLGLGSAFNGVGYYGWIDKDLRQALGQPVKGRYARTYCGGGVPTGTLAGCRKALRASLAKAVRDEVARQGVASVTALTYDKHRDDIKAVTAGVQGVPDIDWQNRPTFQQVVQFSRHR